MPGCRNATIFTSPASAPVWPPWSGWFCRYLVPAGKATALPRRQGVEQKVTKATKKEIPGLWSHFKTVAADACRVVALGAKTGEKAPIFLMNEPRYLGCYGVLMKILGWLRFLLLKFLPFRLKPVPRCVSTPHPRFSFPGNCRARNQFRNPAPCQIVSHNNGVQAQAGGLALGGIDADKNAAGMAAPGKVARNHGDNVCGRSWLRLFR